MWSTACPDWEERLLARRSLVPDLPLFPSERDKALRIFNRLRLPDVIGRPAMAEAAGDWFRDIVGALFGAYDVETNRRMIQEVFLLVPKKNGKSSYAAAVMVTAMIVNRRPEAEYLLIAPTMRIADIAYKQAKGTIRCDPELSKVFHLQDHIRTITDRRSGAQLMIKAADTDVITGSKSTGILVDEVHEFALKSRAAEVYVEIRGALAARPDGFMIQISTQSKAPPVGVFKAELGIARDIRDGLVDLPRLAVLYELPERLAADNGWRSPSTWPLVNPNLGRSVDETFLRTSLIAANREGKEAMALLASQHFNVEVGLSLRNDHWAGARYWEAAADPTITLEELIARSEVAVIGIDGGGRDDLLGLAIMGRDRKTKRWLVWAHAWAQEDVLELRKDIASQLRDLEKAGELTLVTPVDIGAMDDDEEVDHTPQDVREVADLVERVAAAGLLPEKAAIGLDASGVSMIVDELERRGFDPDGQLVPVPQGYRLNGVIKGCERKLGDGTLRHGGQLLMAWVVGNAKVEQRGNAVLVTKQISGSAKIDPLIGVFNCFDLMSRNPEPKRAPTYQMIVV